MPDIKVKFMHPIDGGTTEVEMDDAVTASEAIENLVGAGFINANPQGYKLAKKGGADLDARQTFAAAGVREGDVIRIIPATDAGF